MRKIIIMGYHGIVSPCAEWTGDRLRFLVQLGGLVLALTALRSNLGWSSRSTLRVDTGTCSSVGSMMECTSSHHGSDSQDVEGDSGMCVREEWRWILSRNLSCSVIRTNLTQIIFIYFILHVFSSSSTTTYTQFYTYKEQTNQFLKT